MKKLLFIFLVLAGSTFQLNAQIDNKEIEDQLKEMTTEMQKLMTEFQGLLGNSLEMTDSLVQKGVLPLACLLYTSPSPRDRTRSRMPSSA